MTIKPFELQIITMKNSYNIDIFPHTTILDIKKSIELITSIPVYFQRISLNFDGEELSDNINGNYLESESGGDCYLDLKFLY